jgi:hypothetical protein
MSLLAAFLAAPAAAQQSAPAPSPKPLEPMSRLIGNWRGKINLLDGTVIEARNVFEWSLDGRTILFRAYGISKDGERHVYDGLYGWHTGLKKIVFREHSAFGSTIDGEVEPESDSLVFLWTQYGTKGVVEYREIFRFPDSDSYVTEVERKTGKGWEQFTLENRFVREKQPKSKP